MTVLAYLVDTNWVIDYLSGVPPIINRLHELRDKGLAISVISLAELWEGVYFSRDPEHSEKSLEGFLSRVTTLGIDEAIYKRFGRLRGTLRRQGKLVSDFDLLIAAAALAHDLTLLSNNRSHFERIEGLRIESIDAENLA